MRAPYLYINVTHVSSSEELSRVHYVQPGRNTKNEAHAHLLEMRDSSMSFTPILPKPSHHTIHKVHF